MRKKSTDSLGMTLTETAPPNCPNGSGLEVYVDKVNPNSAAARAGLMPGDQLVRVNDNLVTGVAVAEQLLQSVVSPVICTHLIRVARTTDESCSQSPPSLLCQPIIRVVGKWDRGPGRLCCLLVEQLKRRWQRRSGLDDDNNGSGCGDGRGAGNEVGVTNETPRRLDEDDEEQHSREGLCVHTSPGRLARTMYLQQELYRRWLCGVPATETTEEREGVMKSEVMTEDTVEGAARYKWVMRRREDGSRYISKKCTSPKSSSRNAAHSRRRRGSRHRRKSFSASPSPLSRAFLCCPDNDGLVLDNTHGGPQTGRNTLSVLIL